MNASARFLIRSSRSVHTPPQNYERCSDRRQKFEVAPPQHELSARKLCAASEDWAGLDWAGLPTCAAKGTLTSPMFPVIYLHLAPSRITSPLPSPSQPRRIETPPSPTSFDEATDESGGARLACIKIHAHSPCCWGLYFIDVGLKAAAWEAVTRDLCLPHALGSFSIAAIVRSSGKLDGSRRELVITCSAPLHRLSWLHSWDAVFLPEGNRLLHFRQVGDTCEQRFVTSIKQSANFAWHEFWRMKRIHLI